MLLLTPYIESAIGAKNVEMVNVEQHLWNLQTLSLPIFAMVANKKRIQNFGELSKKIED